jgi:AraC-like DNA-binding protein
MNERTSNDDFRRGAHSLQALREATADICDVRSSESDDEFRVDSATIPFDNALLIQSHASALEYHRTPKHVAHGGMDQYHVTLCLDGQMEFSSGRRNAVMQPGDVCLIDMAQANRTVLAGDVRGGPSRLLALILPRSALAPLLASPDSATASLVSRDNLHGQLLADQLFAFSLPRAEIQPRQSAVAAFAGLVATAVGSARDAESVAERGARDSLIASIKRHIGANLQTETVSADKLCRRFQISRATLYRLFESDGGLWRYVQEQRLNRAFMRLISPASRRDRLIDLAMDCHFSSDATFVRAFRRQFGLTPGEVRRLAGVGAQQRATDAPAAPEALTWFRRAAQN